MKLQIAHRLTIVFTVIALAVGLASGQTEDEEALEVVKEALKGVTLLQQQRFGEAIPRLALLVEAMPDTANLRVMYGVALLGHSKQINDVTEAKRLSAEALVQFQAAKKLGDKTPDLDAYIRILGGGGAEATVSNEGMSDAEKTLAQAESQFARSNYDEAIVLYAKALSLDPTLYEAATHSGDAYVAKQDWENAEKMYQKAIAIDPRRETAYRYSATPLMKQKKFDQARDRYIEAYIAEPYNQMSSRGIDQWASITGAKLGHPEIRLPDVKQAKPANSEDKKVDALKEVWNAYLSVRAEWTKSKFAAAYPSEKTYRHTLKEETEAIRSALRLAMEKKVESPDLKLLQKLDTAGLLEAFVLLSMPDDGIAQDHRPYWNDNRTKLRQYVLDHIITK
jgi:tetratricopeptide (TPR) repeat protein